MSTTSTPKKSTSELVKELIGELGDVKGQLKEVKEQNGQLISAISALMARIAELDSSTKATAEKLGQSSMLAGQRVLTQLEGRLNAAVETVEKKLQAAPIKRSRPASSSSSSGGAKAAKGTRNPIPEFKLITSGCYGKLKNLAGQLVTKYSKNGRVLEIFSKEVMEAGEEKYGPQSNSSDRNRRLKFIAKCLIDNELKESEAAAKLQALHDLIFDTAESAPIEAPTPTPMPTPTTKDIAEAEGKEETKEGNADDVDSLFD